MYVATAVIQGLTQSKRLMVVRRTKTAMEKTINEYTQDPVFKVHSMAWYDDTGGRYHSIGEDPLSPRFSNFEIVDLNFE